MIPIPTNTAVLAAKLEATLGTAIALTNADAGFRVLNPKLTIDGNTIIIPAGTGYTDVAVIPGGRSASLGFDVDLYAGAWRSIFLPACGYKRTAGPPETYVFSPTGSDWKGITATLFYSTFCKFGMYGAMGSWTVKATPGQPAVASFNFKGLHLASPGTLPSTITWETSLPPLFTGSNSLMLGGVAIDCSSFEISGGDNVILIPSSNGTGGFLHAWLTKPRISFSVDPAKNTSSDYLANWLAGSATNKTGIAMVMDGGAGNKITLSTGTDSAALSGVPQVGERDEYLTSPITFAVLDNALTWKFE
jgi:hypothetical protein